jgi:hypothetical protein
MRRRAAFILPLIAAVPLTNALAGLSLSVVPPILDLAVPPGEKKEFTLTIKNLGDSRVEVSPAVMDLALGKTGAAMPVEAGQGAPSCAGWVAMDLSGFSLGPGASVSRNVMFKVPRGVAGGAYCVIVFKAQEAEPRGAGSSLNISTRTGTILMETTTRRSRSSGEIVELAATRLESGGVAVVGLFKNTGEVHLQIRPSCVIRNSEGRVVDRLKTDAGTGTVLPGGIRQISGTWDDKRKMEPGTYQAQMAVDFKGGSRVTRDLGFTIE